MCDISKHVKTELIKRAYNLIGVHKLVEYILKYENLSLSDFSDIDVNRKSIIEQMLHNIEQREWESIVSLLAGFSQNESYNSIVNALDKYIHKWNHIGLLENHVNEASNELRYIEGFIALQKEWKEDIVPLLLHLSQIGNCIEIHMYDRPIDTLNAYIQECERIEQLRHYNNTSMESLEEFHDVCKICGQLREMSSIIEIYYKYLERMNSILSRLL